MCHIFQVNYTAPNDFITLVTCNGVNIWLDLYIPPLLSRAGTGVCDLLTVCTVLCSPGGWIYPSQLDAGLRKSNGDRKEPAGFCAATSLHSTDVTVMSDSQTAASDILPINCWGKLSQAVTSHTEASYCHWQANFPLRTTEEHKGCRVCSFKYILEPFCF